MRTSSRVGGISKSCTIRRKICFYITLSIFLIGLAFVSETNAGLDNGPWPMFGNNNKHTSSVDVEQVAVPYIKWHIDLYGTGDFEGGPTIGSDGTIYLAGNYSDNFLSGCLSAFNPDGSRKWSFEAEQYYTGSVPTIDENGNVYFTAFDGYGQGESEANCYLYSVNSSGQLNWQFFKWSFAEGRRIRSSSPAIGIDGTIYVGSRDQRLIAINQDGSLSWDYPTDGEIVSSPAIGDDGTIYIGSYDYYLYAINPNGTLKWRYRTEGRIISSPTITTDGNVVVGSEDGNVYSITQGGLLDWKFSTYGEVVSTAAAIDDTIFAACKSGYIYALNLEGELLWEKYIGQVAYYPYIYASPVIVGDDTIYLGQYRRLLSIDKSGKIKWAYDHYRDLQTAPALDADGTIYIVSSPDPNGLRSFEAIGFEDGKGAICGFITDMQNDASIGDASISIGVNTVQSNENGYYAISIDPGVYTVTFSQSEYQEITIPNILVESGKSTKLDVELNYPGPINIITTELPPAETIIDYNYRVRITGGVYPYNYSIIYGNLPTGLSIDTNNGIISGIPTTQGSYTFAVAVTDSLGAYAEREFTIEVTQPLEIISSGSLPSATRSSNYFFSIESNGGTSPYSYILTGGTLPSGIYLSSTGNLSGTPLSSGSYDFTIQVTDASDRTDVQSFQLEVVNPLVVSTNRLNDGIVGSAYNQSLTATGGYGDYVWQVYSGTLPAGVSLDSANGVISGTPTQPTYGTIVLAVSDEDGRITYKDFTLEISDPLAIQTATLPSALINNSFSEPIRTSGGIGPFNFSYTGQLPAGLTLDTTTGIISGTPTLAGYTNVSITVSDSTYPASQSVTQTLGIRVTSMLTVTTSAVFPNAKQDVAISPIVLAAGGGPSPYAWQITGGYLPEGITLNPTTGELSGTPQDRGDFVFSVQVTDANSATSVKEFFWHVSGELVITTGVVADAAVGESYSFTLEAGGGLKPYSWRLVSGTLPSGLSFNTTTGTIYGIATTHQSYAFTVEVSDSDSPAQTAQHTYTMEALDELYVFTETLPNGREGEAYTVAISAALGSPPYAWRLESGTLPPGLTLSGSPTVATLEGTPTTIGTYVFTFEVSDTGTPVSYATRQYTVEIYGDVVIDVDDLPTAVRGVPYTSTILSTGGRLPYSWQLTAGDLPLGLGLNSTDGQISGVASMEVGQSSTFTVRVTDAGIPSDFDEKEFSIYVVDPLAITTETLQDAAVGYAYEATLEAEGGLSPHSWYLHSGALPPGLTLDSGTGVISGMAAACGTYDFTIRLEDAAPLATVTTKAFNMSVIAIGDADCDGLPDAVENAYCTDFADSDTDNDGILDGVEDANQNGTVDTGETNPCDPDTDDDGIQDGTESGLTANDVGPDTDLAIFVPDADPASTTNPTLADSDGDGVLDGDEDLNHNGRVDAGESNPNVIEDLPSYKAMPWIPLLLLGD